MFAQFLLEVARGHDCFRETEFDKPSSYDVLSDCQVVGSLAEPEWLDVYRELSRRTAAGENIDGPKLIGCVMRHCGCGRGHSLECEATSETSFEGWARIAENIGPSLAPPMIEEFEYA